MPAWMSSRVLLTVMLVASPAAGLAAPQAQRSPGAAAAQRPQASRASTGIVTGAVTAPDDARLPGTAVAIRNTATGWSVVVVAAADGTYSGSGIPPGDYDITAELTGFELQVVPDVHVRADEAARVDFKLALSTVRETVEVVGVLVRDSIEAAGIRESPARDIGEALSQMNGVAMVRKGAIANDIVLQGYQSRNLTVLIDGERIHGACPNGMDPVLFHADFAEVDHLEVGKGPFDVRHQGSLGGVINVVTRAPWAGLHANPSFAAGSSGYVNPSLTVSYGNARFSALGGYSYRSAAPYRDGTGTLFTQYANYRADTVDSTAFEARTGWVRLHAVPRENHSAQVAYTRQQADHVLYPYLLMDGVSDAAHRLSASYAIAREGGFVSVMSARAYHSRVDHWMTDELRVSSSGMPLAYSMATQAKTRTSGANVDLEILGSTVGVEAFRREWDSTTVMAGSKYAPQYAIPFVTIDSVGAFVDFRRPLSGSTTLEAGARLDYAHSAVDATKANTDLYFAYRGTRAAAVSDTGLSGKVRVIRRIGTHVELSGGIGRTVRVPDPQERFFGLKRMGTDWVGNPGLVPTVNTGVSAAVTYRHRALTTSFSASYDDLAGLVTLHPQSKLSTVAGVMNALARSYANVDGRMANAELSATWRVTDRLFATVNASYTRGTQRPKPEEGVSSVNIAEIPPSRASIVLRYDRAIFFGEAQGLFVGEQSRINADVMEAATAGYGVMNVRIGLKKKGIRVTLALDNLFDRQYLNYLSHQRDPFRTGVRVREPGRNLYANITYQF